VRGEARIPSQGQEPQGLRTWTPAKLGFRGRGTRGRNLSNSRADEGREGERNIPKECPKVSSRNGGKEGPRTGEETRRGKERPKGRSKGTSRGGGKGGTPGTLREERLGEGKKGTLREECSGG
jgi:hypothetical protein